MSIFAKSRAVTEGNQFADIDPGYIEATDSGLQTILYESSQEMYALNAALYISDIQLEQTALTEGTEQAEILMENVLKSTWDKIRAMFQKLWAKIKSWFEAIKRKLALMFTSGKKFVDRFKKEIEEKSTKGFEYEGYDYTLADGEKNIVTLNGEIDGVLKSEVDFSFDEEQMTVSGQHSSVTGRGDAGGNNDTKASKEKVTGGKELSAYYEEARKAFTGGTDQKKDIKEFSANSKDEMMTLVSDGKAQIRSIQNAQSDIDGQFNRVLGTINKVKSSIDKLQEPNRGRMLAYATHKYNVAHYALTVKSGLANIHVKAIEQAAHDFEHILKSFLSYKPAKEGFTPAENGDQTDSLIESAIKHFL